MMPPASRTAQTSSFRRQETIDEGTVSIASRTARLNPLVFTNPKALREAVAEFIGFYNHGRNHEEIDNVTAADVYYGRREEILKQRNEQKQATLESRFRYNLVQGPNQIRSEQGNEQ
jgi:hypothetical protein